MEKWRVATRDEAVKLYFEDESRGIFQVDLVGCCVTAISELQLSFVEKEYKKLFYVVRGE